MFRGFAADEGLFLNVILARMLWMVGRWDGGRQCATLVRVTRRGNTTRVFLRVMRILRNLK